MKEKSLTKSQLVQDVQQVLTDMVRSKGKAKVTRAKLTLVRDCLLCHLIFNTASRPGAIGNMTIKEFNSAVRNDGCYTVRVINHKTDYMGPANIVFNANLYNQSKSYLQYFRNSLTGVSTDESATFFTSWMGGKMDSSLVCTQLINFWNRVRSKTGHCINSTVVRKFTTMSIHENMPDFANDTANLLCQTLKIAQEDYHVYDRQRKAASTSAKISVAQRISLDNGNEKLENDLGTKILEVFKEDVQRKFINKEIVRKKIDEEESLKSARDNPKEQKNFLDSVRYFISKDNQSLSLDVSTSENYPKLPSCSQAAIQKFGKGLVSNLPVKKRFVFTEKENSLIRKHLKSFIRTEKKINKHEFKKFVADIPAMNNIVTKIGIDRLIVKVRTERKKGCD